MAHLAYQPLLSTRNTYLHQKWQKAYDLHREKVKSAKPVIIIPPPKTFRHLADRLKNQKHEKERTMKRENDVLMERISHIMRTAGRIDTWNYYDRKSLGKERRRLEMLRITQENQMMLLRLSQCTSQYSVRSWHEDWLKTLQVMDSITQYPRGKTHQQKQGEDKPTEKSSDCNKEENMKAAASKHIPAGNKAKEDESKKEEEDTEQRWPEPPCHCMDTPADPVLMLIQCPASLTPLRRH